MLVGDKGGIYGLDWLTRPRYISPPTLSLLQVVIKKRGSQVVLCHGRRGTGREKEKGKE